MIWIDIPKTKLDRQADKLLGLVPLKKKRKKGKSRDRAVPKMTYRQYMGSAYWKRRKQSYFSKHGKVCIVCGKKSGTTLHHIVYDNKLYGREPDAHLVALCGKHHGEYHEAFGVKQNMVKSTIEYVNHARQMHVYESETQWIQNLRN